MLRQKTLSGIGGGDHASNSPKRTNIINPNHLSKLCVGKSKW
jgi:hypothetical protein